MSQDDLKVDSANCSSFLPVALTDARLRIKEIEDTIKSLPYEVSVLREAVEKMNNSMDRLLERLESKYVPRELYDARIVAIQEDTAMKRAALRDESSAKIQAARDEASAKLQLAHDESIARIQSVKDELSTKVLVLQGDLEKSATDIRDIKDQNTWILRGCIAGVLYMVREVVISLFHK